MKIASFNVNSLRARLPIVLEWLTQHKPDILCAQETKVPDQDFPAEQLREKGYKCAFAGQKSYNGVAIFSRSQLEEVRFGLDDEPKDQPRLITAKIKGISIINTYIPQGHLPDTDKFYYKLEWFKRLLKFFEKNYNHANPVLWVGDFNIAPEPRDVYDPKRLLGHVCFHPDVHNVLQKVMEWGFVDLFRMHCNDAGQYTFWDYREPNALKHNHGWRLDHIMATRTLAQKCANCYIDKKPRLLEKPSDHTPIVAEFDW